MQQPPHNPYAAPVATRSAYSSHHSGGSPAEWEVGEVYSQALEIFKRHWVTLTFVPLLAFIPVTVVAFAPQLLSLFIDEGNEGLIGAVTVFSNLLYYVLTAIVQVGLVRLFVTAARGQTPDFGMMFSGADRLLPMIAVVFLSSILFALGFLLLIVPGIILMLGLLLAPYYCVDRHQGPIEALKTSWEVTKGHKLKLGLLGVVGFLLTLVGVLACCVGVIPAAAIYYLAIAIVYTRLSGAVGAPASSAFGYPEPAPPPGYSPHGGGYGGPPPGGSTGGGRPPGSYGGGPGGNGG